MSPAKKYQYINLEKLYSSFGHKIELKIKMLTTLVRELPKNVADIQRFYDERNAHELHRTVHKLKPSSSYIGMNAVCLKCTRIERGLRNGETIDHLTDDIPGLILDVYGAIRELTDELSALEKKKAAQKPQ